MSAPTNFQVNGCNSFWKKQLFSLFPMEKPSLEKFDHCHKIGQGQPRVIVWTNYNGLESPMLNTKFRGNLATSSGEDFWRVFTIYGCGGHLVHVTRVPRTNLRSPYPRRLYIKFGFDWPSGFREDLWALWRTDDYDGQTLLWVFYKLTYEPSAQVKAQVS